MHRVYISIGSNVDRERNIVSAVRALRENFGELRLSQVYESDAVGFEGAPFLNLAAGFLSHLSATEIQRGLKLIEADHGRAAEQAGFQSRTLDLDLLLYDELILDEPGLHLPRDEITACAFVLGPLAEIAAGAMHPLCKKSIGALWAQLEFQDQTLRRVDLPLPA